MEITPWGRCIYADPVANVFDSGIPGGKPVWTEGLQPVDASELERGVDYVIFFRGENSDTMNIGA